MAALSAGRHPALTGDSPDQVFRVPPDGLRSPCVACYTAAKRTYDAPMSMRPLPAEPHEERSSIWSLPARLRMRYREAAAERPDEEINLRVLTSFVGTFATVRIITHGIRGNWLPLKNIELGGKRGSHPLHIHHLVWGILTLTGCGYMTLLRSEHRWRRWLALPYGAGAALTFDEFALWLRLEDDYWSSQGRASVDAVVLLSAVFGMAVAAPSFWQRIFDEVVKTASPARLSGKIRKSTTQSA